MSKHVAIEENDLAPDGAGELSLISYRPATYQAEAIHEE